MIALLAAGCTSGGVTSGQTATPAPGLSAAPGYASARYLGAMLGHPEGNAYHESAQIDTMRDYVAFAAGNRDHAVYDVDFARERVVILRDVFPPIPACTGEEFAFRDDPNELTYTTRVVGTPPPQPCAVAPLPPGEHFAAFALVKGGKPVRGVRPFAQLVPTRPVPSPAGELPTPTPDGSASICPPPANDLVAITTGTIFDQHGARVQAPVEIEILSLHPNIPYRARVFSEAGTWVVNNVPNSGRVSVSARLACGQRVTRTLDPGHAPGFTPAPCVTRPYRYDVNFGGPATPRDPDAPLFALQVAPGPLPSGSPSPCPEASRSPEASP